MYEPVFIVVANQGKMSGGWALNEVGVPAVRPVAIESIIDPQLLEAGA